MMQKATSAGRATESIHKPAASPDRAVWLFSAPIDLSVFLGSAVVSLLALWIGAQAGVLHDETPDWAWVP
ncbi:MAG TPA: hypothetical protein VNO14_08815, partial [Blastocatellia bacterium]|nr:hypothetical protein [Blastocatellia bacterium]